jgi:cytidine deaminase
MQHDKGKPDFISYNPLRTSQWRPHSSSSFAIVSMVISIAFSFLLVLCSAPCGACLQVMRDVEQRQGKPIRILLKGASAPVYEAESVATFLPFGFALTAK